MTKIKALGGRCVGWKATWTPYDRGWYTLMARTVNLESPWELQVSDAHEQGLVAATMSPAVLPRERSTALRGLVPRFQGV